MKLISLLISVTMILLSGCVSVHSISVSSMNEKVNDKNSRMISVESEDRSFLHLVTPELNVMQDLRDKCQNGIVHGVETTLSTRDFIILQFYNLEAVAICTTR